MTAGRSARRSAHAGGTARHRARELAFRIAYESDVNDDSCARVWQALSAEQHLSGDQRELVAAVIGVLDRSRAQVDGQLSAATEHWPLDRLSATDRAVLRAAVAELMGYPGSPARVVLDEAIEIAKRFGTEESGRFVNGVLDRVARALRPAEF
jgi:N utilization substance protein B